MAVGVEVAEVEGEAVSCWVSPSTWRNSQRRLPPPVLLLLCVV